MDHRIDMMSLCCDKIQGLGLGLGDTQSDQVLRMTSTK